MFCRVLLAALCLFTCLGGMPQAHGASGPQLPDVNLALGAPVTSSGPTWDGLLPSALTDGNPNTFSHPQSGTKTLGFYFEIDLGHTYRLDRILIYNRNDGCCPERLSRYGVEIYADAGGETGALNWSTTVRTNNSNSGNGGIDTVRASNGTNGPFEGRFVRIVNRNNGAYTPQVAEVEVYGLKLPLIQVFEATDDNLSTGQSTDLHWQILNADSAFLSEGLGAVNATNGSVTIHPSASTTYTLTASNVAGTITASVAVGINVSLLPPVITEFMASNSGTLSDEDGDSSDWIELHNPNVYSLPLEGLTLRNSGDNWVFPAVKIRGNGYLVVFASGKDRRDPTAQLHTKFNLSAKGDYLGLIDRDGTTVLQQFPKDYPKNVFFPKQKSNISYGIDVNGKEGFFRPATPGATNGVSYAGIVEDTAFNIHRGFYDTNLSVTITSPTADAIIRYTLNGTEPTETKGSLYSQPLKITTNTIVRAAAFKPGWAPTDIDTQSYLFPSNVIQSSVMSKSITKHPVYGPQMYAALLDVPSVSLVTEQPINDNFEVPGSFEWINPDGKPGAHAHCGARHYGGAFTDFAKKSFRLYFRAEYGDSKLHYPIYEGYDRSLLAADSFDEIELRNCSHDMAMRGFYMSNLFTDDVLLEMGQLNPHGRFVHLYLNGVYWGLYHIRERWSASMHASYLGGSKSDYESINGNWNVGGWADPGVPYDGDGTAWDRIKSLRGNYVQVKPYLNVPQYVDYMLMWMFGGSEDEYRCVGPTVPGSGFKFYLNDADGWFCGPYYCAAGDRTSRGAPGRDNGDGPGSIFSMLFKEANPEYRILLADHIYKALFNNGALTATRNVSRLRELCTEIQRAFYAEAARWNYLAPSEWATRRDQALTQWLPTRTAEALTQWRNAGFYPRLDAPSAYVAPNTEGPGVFLRFLGPTNKVIYYTTNGDDPRLIGGTVSPNARTHQVTGVKQTLLPAGSVWKWFSDVNGLGRSDIVVGNTNYSAANWKHPQFGDSSWAQGRAELGYGEGDEATVIPNLSGTNTLITAYFRTHFQVTNVQNYFALELRLKRDDGAIVYLNGVSATRSSMPTGNVTGRTPGSLATDDGQKFSSFSIPSSLLVEGDNVIAVELHQTTTNDDASFDLELNGVRSSPVGDALPPVLVNTVFKCRAKDGTQWSALNEIFVQAESRPVFPGDVVISELNFDPAGPDTTEFIELANTSRHALNLRGARFTEGVDYLFSTYLDTLLAPGQRLLLVQDLFHFQQLYGLDHPVQGVFVGNLKNGGERLTLSDANQQPLVSMAYQTSANWPQGAHGGGYSLVLSHPELGLDQPEAWRISTITNGTPGTSDSISFKGDPSADRDNDGLPALVEYALGTSDTNADSGRSSLHASVDANGHFLLQFPRRLSADDVVLAVEWSTDLGHWNSATLLSNDTGAPGYALESWGVGTDGAKTLFLRLTAH